MTPATASGDFISATASERALHRSLIRCGVQSDEPVCVTLHSIPMAPMMTAPATGEERGQGVPELRREIEVLDLVDRTATAALRSTAVRQYPHPGRSGSGWEIVPAPCQPT